VWRFFGFDFSNSLVEITQSWFLSKYLKICLKFFGVLVKNWFEMWYSLKLMSPSLSISKAPKNCSVTSVLSRTLMFSSWASDSTSPIHFSMALRTCFGVSDWEKSLMSTLLPNSLNSLVILFPSYYSHGVKALISLTVIIPSSLSSINLMNDLVKFSSPKEYKKSLTDDVKKRCNGEEIEYNTCDKNCVFDHLDLELNYKCKNQIFWIIIKN